MTMIGRVIDGLPLAASMQSDQDVSLCTMHLFLLVQFSLTIDIYDAVFFLINLRINI